MASVTARAGVTGFLKVLATEVAPDGVTVNSAQPGAHATGRLASSTRSADDIAKDVPVGFIGDPADFGKSVAFLCSEPARFITGTSLLIDGGSYTGLM
jgi:3-oxoacyl-[acyl-carrier protein] reductase